nr:putative ORF1 [Marmot picobirnavirus]
MVTEQHYQRADTLGQSRLAADVSLGRQTLGESQRHNQEVERETQRHNSLTEQLEDRRVGIQAFNFPGGGVVSEFIRYGTDSNQSEIPPAAENLAEGFSKLAESIQDGFQVWRGFGKAIDKKILGIK